MTELNIGIDISKSHLDAFCLEDGMSQRFDNTVKGFRCLRSWIGKRPVARIVFEATGPYHAAFERALAGALPLVKVNPLQARRFAQACGTRSKTDAIDARMLARMGSALALEPDRPASRMSIDLKELQVGRQGLVKERTRLRNRAQIVETRILQRQITARLALVEKQIKDLDAEIAALIEKDDGTARKQQILCSIPGIGAVAAAAILAFLPEIGTLERKQVASLAGLAPYIRQSGQWQGKSFISGGRKPVRDALYMPALVAMRFNPDLETKYKILRMVGKPAKVALVALMRKLIEMANALVKSDRLWVPKNA